MIMRLDPCVVLGVGMSGSCSAMSYLDRIALKADIEFATAKIADALANYGLTLFNQSKKINFGGAYWIFDQPTQMVEMCETLMPAVSIDYSSNPVGCDTVATVSIQAEIDTLETFAFADAIYDDPTFAGNGVAWKVEHFSTSGIKLSTKAYNLSVIDRDGVVHYPEEIGMLITTYRPTRVYSRHLSKCGCIAQSPCDVLTKETLVERCVIVRPDGDGITVMSPSQCSCNIGKPLGYVMKVTQDGVMDTSIAEAIVSLANSRATLNTCSACSPDAQSRLRRDLGITDKGEDMKARTPWAFSNPLGVMTPGGVAAWSTITLKFGVAGVAGHV